MIELKYLTPTGRLGAAFLFLPHWRPEMITPSEWEAGGAWCSEFSLPGAKQMKCSRPCGRIPITGVAALDIRREEPASGGVRCALSLS